MKSFTLRTLAVSIDRLGLNFKFGFGVVDAVETDNATVQATSTDDVVGVSGCIQMNPWGFAGHDELKAQSYKIVPVLLNLFCKTINDFLAKDTEPRTSVQYRDVLYEECTKAAQAKYGDEFPALAVCVCFAPFEFAIHDAYSKTWGVSWEKCLTKDYLGDEDFSDIFLPAPKNRTPFLLTIGGFDAPMPEDLKQPNYAASILRPDAPNLSVWQQLHFTGAKNIKPKSGGSLEADKARMDEVDRALWQYKEDANLEVLFQTYFDSNGTFKTVDEFARTIDAVGSVEGLRSMLNWEQPFSVHDTFRKGFEVHRFQGYGTCSIDESAVTVEDIVRAHEMGYGRVGAKVGKGLFPLLRMIQKAKELGMAYDIQDLTQALYGMVVSASVAACLGCPMEANGWKYVADAEKLLELGNYEGILYPKYGGFDTSNLTGSGFSAA